MRKRLDGIHIHQKDKSDIYWHIIFPSAEKETFNNVVTYIDNSMFVDVNLLSSKYRKIGLASVGDALSEAGYQDYENCEMFLEVDFPELTKEKRHIAAKQNCWKFSLSAKVSDTRIRVLEVHVNKSSGFIEFRKLYNEARTE